MIPATNNKVLVSEDWKKIYQSFKNADFKSYDFETLRRTMIQYLQENYPEDFNDFIDSSEYIALIDLIAYLGQNLSFRIDLNARENFLETAQRRDSILRLAQLVSYNPVRNTPANGFLKVTAVSTTDSIFDSNGTNLANTTIAWNDVTNSDWYQQFINIMNSVMSSSFGTPQDRKVIDGILTEQYSIRSSNVDTPIYTFTKNIDSTSMVFEVVPCTFANTEYVYEQPPKPAAAFSLIYKNDNQGSGSVNTGFLIHFRQGTLNLSQFSLDNPIPNEIIGINAPNINNSDVWLWQLDKNGNFDTLWTPVQSVSNNYNNIVYNSLNKNLKTIYAISTRDEDQIDLNFADGVFGNLPKGDFRLLYRQSNAQTYVIKPEQLSGITITIPYTNANNQPQSLTLTLSLQYTVRNASGSESNASIQLKAPQNYYIQNRMVTGEDYNIGPLTAGTDIIKVKSVNRISSGLSKFFDISDVTGKYSSTNIFGTDGMLYQEYVEEYFEFESTNRNQVLAVVKNQLAPIISSAGLKSFYLEKFSRYDISDLSLSWVEVNKTPGQSRGYLTNSEEPVSVGTFTTNNLRFIVPGALIKFVAPVNRYFDSKNNLKVTPSTGIPSTGKTYVWANVSHVVDDGSNGGIGALSDGTGPIILSIRVPTQAIPVQIIPKYVSILPLVIENEIVNFCEAQRNFGLTINNISRVWDIILSSNVNLTSSFNISDQGNNEDLGLDSSWLIAFVWDGKKYRVRSRILNYIFESEKEISFYIDQNSINYDFSSNQIVKDKIDVLAVNSLSTSTNNLGVDYSWQIDGPIVEVDGYVQPSKVKISFYNFNNLGQINDPDSFVNIVSPESTSTNVETAGFRDKFLYFKKLSDGMRYQLTDDVITAYPNETDFFLKNPDQSLIDGNSLYYFYDDSANVVKYWSTLTSSLIYTDQYFAKSGRSNIKFHYLHNTNSERRIDPSKTNIIDVYILSLSYDTEFRSWLLGNVSTKPLPPTSHSLEINYGEKLNLIKSISDEIIFHPVKYKVLFGTDADINLQGIFKAVRNSTLITSDSDLKSRILLAIEEFFALEHWEFGQSFYFSELSAYVMNKLTPDITNFIIVPRSNSNFGSLYEIASQSDEIFISGVKVSDIEIIDAVTASQLKSTTSSGT
jgi:hypothetical protein